MLDKLRRADEALGRKIYDSRETFEPVSTIVFLTADEATMYPLCFVLALTHWGSCGSCTSVDAFLSISFCALMEAALKVVFRRERPGYKGNRGAGIMLCDQFSFPSGHALRASYIVGYLHWNAQLRTCFYQGQNWSPLCSLMLVVWCVLVAITRVLHGKHYPIDSVCGLIAGFCLSYVFEHASSSLSGYRQERFLAMGVAFTLQLGAILLSTTLRETVPQWAIMAGVIAVSWAVLGIYDNVCPT